MAAPGHPAVDWAGHGEDLATLFAGEPGGDERSRAVGCLDHDRAEREPRHDSVAPGEPACDGSGQRRRLAHDRPAVGDLQGKIGMLRGIDLEHPRAEHGDRAAARLEGTAVSGVVDAAGEAAHDRIPRPGQAAGELMGHAAAVRGGMTRPHDRDGQSVARLERAAEE